MSCFRLRLGKTALNRCFLVSHGKAPLFLRLLAPHAAREADEAQRAAALTQCPSILRHVAKSSATSQCRTLRPASFFNMQSTVLPSQCLGIWTYLDSLDAGSMYFCSQRHRMRTWRNVTRRLQSSSVHCRSCKAVALPVRRSRRCWRREHSKRPKEKMKSW